MAPVLFQTLPGLFGFAAAVVLTEISVLLIATGKRFLRQVSVAAVAVVGAVAGEAIGLSLSASAPWAGIFAGLAGGAILGYYLRPVGVGLALAYVGFSVAGNLVSLAYVEYMAALVLFAYGLLLTDLAPTFASSLLSSSILLLVGEWAGISTPALVVLVSAGGAARIMASVLPTRLALRNKRPPIST